MRQADVTNELAQQVFEAIQILLAGFEAAAQRDNSRLLYDSVAEGNDQVYGGLLTVLMRLVFLLYAEERGLMPVESAFYSQHLGVSGLFGQLQRDAGEFPDTMARRFGAWPRLLSLWRGVFLGMSHPEFETPPRRGHLFDPQVFPFLEDWMSGRGVPLTLAEERAAVRTPSVDDGPSMGCWSACWFSEANGCPTRRWTSSRSAASMSG